jgi:hypothetical protein
VCSGRLVDEQLTRAIRGESAFALEYWFGLAANKVTLWRKPLDVEGWNGTEGTRRLVQAGQERRVAKLRGKRLPPGQVERQRQTARKLDRRRHLAAANQERAWPAEHLALLGTLTDAEVAARTGRGENAMRVKRCKLGIPNPSGPGWTEDELALLGTAPDAEVAAEIGRTEGAVTLKRCRLRIATFRDRRRGNR